MSSYGRTGFVRVAMAAGMMCVAASTCAQYPGQVQVEKKATPELRSIAVVEWTGEEGKPAHSRIVPIAVLDQGTLEDGGIYLAQPEPLALDSGVVYELEQNGKKIGLYQVSAAGQQEGNWVGIGVWKPLVKSAPKPPPRPVRIDEDYANSDEPVLHRKHHPGDSSSGGSGSGGSGNSAPAPDPDRPTLHRTDTSEDTGTGGGSGSGSTNNSGTGSASGASGSGSGSASAGDANGPVLHRRGDASNSSGSGTNSGGSSSSGSGSGGSTTASTTTDPDRPTLHRQSSDSESDAPPSDPDRPRMTKKQNTTDEAYVSSVAGSVDPNRPRLQRGMHADDVDDVKPSAALTGMPVDLHQMVAVSDTQPIPEHPWSYSWADPGDAAKMQTAMEEIARRDLTAAAPQPAPAKAAPAKTTAARRKAHPAPAPPPMALKDEQFRAFELAYGSGATMVLTAHTDGTGAAEKYITLIAQTDLYGNPLVLLKSVTDGAHLDDTPSMHLIDAVDAMADNRGELLFELRGSTGRQFALYRVLRGQVNKLFVTGGAANGGE